MQHILLKSKNAVVVGEGSIARFCLELVISKGYAVQAVITGDQQLANWVTSQGIAVIKWQGEADLDQSLGAYTIDLLVSVGNLYPIPAAVLSCVRSSDGLALNVHDGPMHDFLGFNTPAWAILNGKAQHQVCWHTITPALYQGDLLSQVDIEIEPEETAMTLNAKCFAAALTSFELILERLEQSGVELHPGPQPDLTQVNYFLRKQRPATSGYLDPQASLAQTLTQLRAFDTGHTHNPLCLPKIRLNEQVWHVTSAECRETDLGQALSGQVSLGQVVAVDQNKLLLNFSDGLVELTLAPVSILQTEPVFTAELLGSCVVSFKEQHQALASLSQHYGQWEDWWFEQLQGFTPLSLPYIGSQTSLGARFESLQLNTADLSANELTRAVCILAAYLSRLCDQASFGSPVVFDSNYAGPPECGLLAGQLGAPRASFQFTFEFEQSLAAQTSAFHKTWQALLQAGQFACDFIKRNSALASCPAALEQAYCVFISDDTDQNLQTRFACFSKTALAVVISPELQTLRLVTFGGLIKPLAQIVAEISYFASEVNQAVAVLPLGQVSLVTPAEQALLKQWSVGKAQPVDKLLFERLDAVYTRLPSKIAVYHRQHTLTFAQLAMQVQQVCAALQLAKVQPGEFVGVMMPRCLQLLPSLLGVMASGATCVPMDPGYPNERLEYVIADSKLNTIICVEPHTTLKSKVLQLTWSAIQASPQPAPSQASRPGIKAHDLAYMLYTSGSSGKPKGVMVEHLNLANFFDAMNETVPLAEVSVWLAVTSISFDIALLELLWTLTRGVAVVLYDGQDIQGAHETLEQPEPIIMPISEAAEHSERAMDFGLFFWNISNDSDVPGPHQYELLLKAAEYGDQNGFSAVWTPERHFGDFGGLYPNPAITSAAVAAITKRIHLRAGSCVFPLHHPVRIAEDWAIIDNISNGRVGLSAAPGWMPNDFIIMPENHAHAKEKMFENVALVQKLWRGEKVTFPGPQGPVDILTLPRPVQKNIPIWITTGGNPENFSRAGALGANLLTHLLGQTPVELAEKIRLYNQAWVEAGHPGQGCVTVMLHTLVAETREQARAITLEPMKNYLKTALFLVKAAAWDWPLFKKLSDNQSQNLDDFFTTISDEDLDALLEFAFDRYFKTSGLFGTIADCVAFADQLYAIGVSEIGCLIDYGVDTPTVLKHLPYLKAVLTEVNQPGRRQALATAQSQSNHSHSTFGVAALIKRHAVTHLQVTPSMARLFLSDPDITQAMQHLDTVLVGGEALPLDLAQNLKGLIKGPLLNMYGPTETTIWSSVYRMDEKPSTVALGQAVVNTQLSIVDTRRQPLPIGAIGELLIGGQGVVRGYWQRPDLTADKFLVDYPAYTSAAKVYATGDLARYLPDGRLLFLGRNDFQVKVRGYRIELEEIETVLLQIPGIAAAVVQPVVYSGAEPRLVGYYTLTCEAQNGPVPITAAGLKEALQSLLPPFMVPNAFVKLESFPLTPNAKIDRKALPIPSVSAELDPAQSDDTLGNASDSERQVLAIWRDILGTQAFGLDDNFFDHGGHSLLVVDVMTRVRPLFNKQIKLVDLFRYPRVRQLVAYLSEDADSGESAVIAGAQSRAAARKAARRRQ